MCDITEGPPIVINDKNQSVYIIMFEKNGLSLFDSGGRLAGWNRNDDDYEAPDDDPGKNNNNNNN